MKYFSSKMPTGLYLELYFIFLSWLQVDNAVVSTILTVLYQMTFSMSMCYCNYNHEYITWIFIEWMYSSGELFMCSLEGYFGVYFPSCEVTREINTQLTLEWMHKEFITGVHTLSYFLHDITNPYMTMKWWSSHIALVSHSLVLHSADNVTINC